MREWLPILIGALTGYLAHFGRVIYDTGWPHVQEVVGYALQLGFIIVLAAFAAEQFGLSSDLAKSATAAAMAISAQELIKLAKDKARKAADKLLDPD